MGEDNSSIASPAAEEPFSLLSTTPTPLQGRGDKEAAGLRSEFRTGIPEGVTVSSRGLSSYYSEKLPGYR